MCIRDRCGLVADPAHGGALHVLCLVDGIVAEATGEGFGQDHQIGFTGQGLDQVTVVLAIATVSYTHLDVYKRQACARSSDGNAKWSMPIYT